MAADPHRPRTRDEIIDELELEIPALAKVATRAAYERSLRAGNTVYIVENGAIVAVSPDGTRRVVKQLLPRTPVRKGSRRTLR